jgi:prepilin-type N-terminal cleavage/methylation domain-containing protein
MLEKTKKIVQLMIQDRTGVSLIELLVAMSVFTIMMLSATGIFQYIIEGQRSALAAQNTQESLRYVMELFAKQIRSAERDLTGVCNDVPDTDVFAVTTNADGDVLNFKYVNSLDESECLSYYLNGETLMVDKQDVASGISYSAAATPAKIRLTDLKFIAVDNALSQPRVTINLDAEALGKQMHKQSLKLQTTISSRLYD